METKILFKEQQRFRQWWLWCLLGLIALTVVISLYAALRESAKNWPAMLLVSLPLLLIVLFALIRLDTEIRTDGIYVRFFPLQTRYRLYRWDAIDHLFVRQYYPLREYGGWGIRGWNKNRALNVSGDQGLQLILKDNRKLLIGTRKPEALAALLPSLPVPQQ